MSRKQSKPRSTPDPEGQDLGSFQFTPSGLDLKWTKDMITVFDGYRINRCFDLTFIEKAIGQGQMPRSFVDQWRFIRTVLHRFAAVSPEVPGVMKFYQRRQALRYAATILMTIAVPLMVATYVFSLLMIAWITLPLTATAVIFFVVQWTVGHHYNRKVAWLIEDYWREHPALLAKEKDALKTWIQSLITHARFRLKKEEVDSGKNPIKFYNRDYEGIVVKAEPNWYRKHYVVHILT